MLRTRVEQPVERERVDAGVDLADLPLGRAWRPSPRRYVQSARRIADDAAVAVRVVDDGGDDRRRGARRLRADRPAFSSVSADRSGTSPDSSTSVPVALRQRRLGRQQRVAGAELWLLHHKREARMRAQAPPVSASA